MLIDDKLLFLFLSLFLSLILILPLRRSLTQ